MIPVRFRPAGFFSSAAGVPLIVASLTLALFARSLGNGFVDWDDPVNFLDNPHFRGLGWPQIKWMFTSAIAAHWAPVTWLTLGVDYVIWGMNPFGYHLTNVLLHALNGALFSLVAWRLLRLAMPAASPTGLALGAGTAALFFAAHPLRVESVAWISERRDVVSGLFYLLAVLSYLAMTGADGSSRARWLAISVACHAAAAGAKAIVMTLPVVLVLLDIYPLRRLPARWREWSRPGTRSIVREKIPYLLVSIVSAGVTLVMLRSQDLLTSTETFPVSARIPVLLYAFVFYVGKTVFPANLTPIHELPARVDLLAPPFLGSAIAVIAVTGAFYALRRRWPAGLTVWLWYLVAVSPVSGVALWSQASRQVVAERYSYLSCLGWAVLVGAGVCALADGRLSAIASPWCHRLAATAVAVWIVGLGVLTWQQIWVWKDSETLWRYTLEVDATCALCHNQMAAEFDRRGLRAAALGHFARAVALRPGEPGLRLNLGGALLKAGRPADAVVELRRTLDQKADFVAAQSALGWALISQGKPAEAMEQLGRAVRSRPNYADALAGMGIALNMQGRPNEALPYLERSVALKPEDRMSRFGLAQAYAALGLSERAREQSEVLRRLDPRLADELGRAVPLAN